MSNDEKKGPVVVDIRGLNQIVESDPYSMSLQVDIIEAVSDAKYISVIDATALFYQFRVRSIDRHKLTVRNIFRSHLWDSKILRLMLNDEMICNARAEQRIVALKNLIIIQSLSSHYFHGFSIFFLKQRRRGGKT
jgi:capsular polysaccharide biosynthesis protein